ncbi:MAG: molybdate ABC transporter substrate-binding protein [Actinomycetes bacterium]
MKPLSNRLVATLVASLSIAGCGLADGGPRGSAAHGKSEITVFAAASLTGAFTELGRQFQVAHPEAKVRFDFDASSTLAEQINQGAPADVFASAAQINMQQLVAAGRVEHPLVFASNSAAIAVAPRLRDRVRTLADLTRPGLKVAVCQPQVPCGALAATVFRNAGLRVHPVTEGLDVKTTLATVTSGQADVAVVYVTDVQAARSSVVAIPIPSADNARSRYPIGVVTGRPHTELAAAFEQFVTSSAGQAVLSAAGFGPP